MSVVVELPPQLTRLVGGDHPVRHRQGERTTRARDPSSLLPLASIPVAGREASRPSPCPGAALHQGGRLGGAGAAHGRFTRRGRCLGGRSQRDARRVGWQRPAHPHLRRPRGARGRMGSLVGGIRGGDELADRACEDAPWRGQPDPGAAGAARAGPTSPRLIAPRRATPYLALPSSSPAFRRPILGRPYQVLPSLPATGAS